VETVSDRDYKQVCSFREREDEHINGAWESIKENIKTSATESLGMHEMKQHGLMRNV
jgi:hypothetical protein